MTPYSPAVACALAAILLGCGPRDTGTPQDGTTTGAVSGAATDTAGMTGTRSTSDTSGMSGASTGSMQDTSSTSGATTQNRTDSGQATDSAKGNQTKSGVTDTKTGKSTMGKRVTKTRPDQGQPVTAKGDTLNAGQDSGMSPHDSSSSPR